MLFKLKDEKIVVIKVIRVCIFHAYPRTALQVEMLFKLDLRRWYQKVCLSLSQFRNMNQHFRTILKVHFKEQNHQRKAQKCVNILLHRSGKGPLSQHATWVLPSLTSAGNVVTGRLNFFHLHVTLNVSQMQILGLQTSFSRKVSF